MEDLSHILISKIPVKDGLPALPEAVMDGFSNVQQIVATTTLMGFEEATDGNE